MLDLIDVDGRRHVTKKVKKNLISRKIKNSRKSKKMGLHVVLLDILGGELGNLLKSVFDIGIILRGGLEVGNLVVLAPVLDFGLLHLSLILEVDLVPENHEWELFGVLYSAVLDELFLPLLKVLERLTQKLDQNTQFRACFNK